jgi:uncharacterized protein (TIGR02300 family)
MGKPELGTKVACTACHERFYDLNRSPAKCPKCGAEQQPERPRALRTPRSTFGTRLLPRQAPATATVDDDAEPAGTADDEAEDDAPESEDEADDDIEINPDLARTSD